MKKSIKIILPIALSLILIIGAGALSLYSARWRNAADFETYSKDFESIASLVYKDYGKSKDADGTVLGIGRNSEGNYYISDGDVILKLTSAQQNSMNNIFAAFTYDYSYPDRIVVYQNRVSFHITSNQYALVYSPDGAKPTFLNSPDENAKIHIKVINKNWYHVAKDDTAPFAF